MPAQAVPKMLTTPTASGDGLWTIYTGKAVRTCIPALHDGPIELVIDLATLTADDAEIPATFEHEIGIGTWRDIAIKPAGISLRLNLLETPDDTRGLPMFDSARQVRASMSQKYPWQASLGAKPGPTGTYELAAGPVEVNGQTFTPGDIPLVILRNGKLYESAVCFFGADDDTGRVAATRLIPKTPEHPVTDKSLKERHVALSAKLGANYAASISALLIDGSTDEQVVDTVRCEDAATQTASLAKLTADLAASNAKCVELQTQLDALKPPETKTTVAGAQLSGASGGGNDAAPVSRLAAMRDGVRLSDGKVLKGIAALSHLNATHPNLPVSTPAK